jgi:hypothetical protein
MFPSDGWCWYAIAFTGKGDVGAQVHSYITGNRRKLQLSCVDMKINIKLKS